MTRLLLAIFLLLPAVLNAQDTTACDNQEGLQFDLDGDMLVGVGDLVQFLSWFGANFDVDQDGVLDCEDECVGEYDECGVCNGPGPQVLAIDTIIITYDSVYVAAIDDWLVYELGTDTLFSLVCEESNVFISCGDDVEMDGYDYSTVLIGDQCWFVENLRTTTYSNGDVIPAGLTDSEWVSTTEGATAVYGEGSSTCYANSPDIDACGEGQSLEEYGRLYNWYAVDDSRGLCPSGWHVPTDGEWTDLEDYITSQGFDGMEGTALKSTSGWAGGNGTDDFGFSALPGGYRNDFNGGFGYAGNDGYWWSSSPSGGSAWPRNLWVYYPGILRSFSNPRSGFSVRCLRDADQTETQGCTDPAYTEYDASANTDDGSCATPVVEGCTDPAYTEYDALANTDDGSCATLDSSCSEVEMDGYTYSLVQIGDQCWFAENLRTTVYGNGDAIPAGLTDGEWDSTASGATAVFGEGSSACYANSPDIDACDEAQSLEEYGRLYNWYAVDDSRGLCPSGWHVPTDGEWTDLEDYITSQGFDGMEGTALKSTSGWAGGNGTDDFGFSALPGGCRSYGDGNFYDAGHYGYWRSSSPSGGSAWSRGLDAYGPDISRYTTNPRNGFSVRCLRDADQTETQGCTDPAYTEYDASANTDDGSCATPVVEGCTDPGYIEYDASANTDDGSCATFVVEGCTDPAYTEYDASANTDDGSCATLVVEGCTDPAYTEYDAAANTDDGSCATPVVEGCTDPAYTEYDASANTDDGSCATLDSSCSEVEMDGYTYSLVQIGDQCWFAENLRTTVYGNGDVIPAGLTDGEWSSTTSGATAVFGEGSSTCVSLSPDIDACDEAQSLEEYGRLYNWYAVDDARGLCPSGWHVPTVGEWCDLEDYIESQGFDGMEGTALKSTSGWYDGGNGTDDFGFSALPGGRRVFDNGNGNIIFVAGYYGYWWSSSSLGSAWYQKVNYDTGGFYGDLINLGYGHSVRCLRDAE